MSMPTGEVANITHIGEERLVNGLILKGVVYVPAFKQNLISIHNLIAGGDYKVEFTSICCVIRDQKKDAILGVGKAHKGVYYLVNKSMSGVMKEAESHAISRATTGKVNTVKVRCEDTFSF